MYLSFRLLAPVLPGQIWRERARRVAQRLVFFAQVPIAAPVVGSFRRQALLALGRVAGVLLAALGLVAAAAVAARPDAWAMGPQRVGVAMLAAVGTSAGPVLPVAAGLGTATLLGALRRRGDLVGLRAQGIGAGAMARVLLLPAVLLVLAAAGWGELAEPAAWRAVHRVRGAPALAAAAWESLQSGEGRTVPGGAVVLEGGALVAASEDLAFEGQLQDLRPQGARWVFDGARVDTPDGRWTTGPGRLRLRDEVRWSAPPTSPRAAHLSALLVRGDERSRQILHRRLALPWAVGLWFLLPLLPALGGLRAPLLAVGWLLAVRAVDQSGLAAAAVGWAPVWLLLPGLALAAAEARR